MSSVCDVVIPVKNAVWWVALCLEELFRNSATDELGKIIVVDDSSTADSFATLTRICARHPRATLFRNTGGPGFGGACNFGMEQSKAGYVLFLNTDCLITPGTIRKLVAACESDPSIGMACPLSNNSPVLTLPMLPGRSYLEMNALLEGAFAGKPPSAVVLDACTVVGNCLLVTRSCWDATGGFDPVWGTGYGEETDLQMRAMGKGFRGVVRVDTYVYHFGSATFRYDPNLVEKQKQALSNFFSKWGERYKDYAAHCSTRDPVKEAEKAVRGLPAQELRPDVLFILPGISQSVGGVHVVLEICNHLLRNGVDAKCAVVGNLNPGLAQYQEPILFGPLQFPHESRLVLDKTLQPRMIAATLYSTSLPAYAFSRMRGIPLLNFIQGYEFYFDNGMRRREVEDAYAVADEAIVTSPWLEAGVKKHTPEKPVSLLPIGVNPYLFAPPERLHSTSDKIRIGMVLRTAPDKGQWVLQEFLHGLLRHQASLCLTVFLSDSHSAPSGWSSLPETILVNLPQDRGAIAERLKECDVFVDGSFHEGFGLMPLEAMACGAAVVVSNSGGVGQFVRDGENGLLIAEVNQPERYLAAIERLMADRQLLARMRSAARETAARFRQDDCYQRYVTFFRDRLQAHTLSAAQAAEELKPRIRIDELVNSANPDSVVLRATGGDPSLLLPEFRMPPGSIPVAFVDILSPVDTDLQLFYPARKPEAALRKMLKNARDALRQVMHRGTLRARGDSYSEECSVWRKLKTGRNQLFIDLGAASIPGRLRLDPAQRPGDYVLNALEIRAFAAEAVPADIGRLDLAQFDLAPFTCYRLAAQDERPNLEPLNDLKIVRPDLRVWAPGSTLRIHLPAIDQGKASLLSVTVDITSPADGEIKLFSGPRNGSTTPIRRCGATRHLQGGRNVVTFVIDRDESDRSLWLDAAIVSGDYQINSVAIRDISTARQSPDA